MTWVRVEERREEQAPETPVEGAAWHSRPVLSETALRWRKRPASKPAGGHRSPAPSSTCYVASTAKELHFESDSTLINLNLNSHT